MATGFGALRHDDIGAQVDSLPGLVQIRDLNDQGRSRLADMFHEGARVAEGQHDRAGAYSSASSTGAASMAQVRKPTPHGLSMSEAMIDTSRASHSRSPFPAPSIPSPPPRDTAPASAPPAEPPIGASAIGCRTPNSSVNCVDNAIPASSST